MPMFRELYQLGKAQLTTRMFGYLRKVWGGELLERTDVRNLKAEAKILRHLMTHFPKIPHCSACMRAKMCANNAPVRKHDPDEAPSKFGEQVTADHIIAQDVVDESVLGDRTALIVLDRATKWLDAFPLLTKTALDTANALKEFLGPEDKIESFYSDSSPELKKVAHDNGWEHTASTPGRPETNGVAERALLPARRWCHGCEHF